MIKRLNKNKNGFSLLELLLVIFITSIMTLLVTGMIVSSLKNYRSKKQIVELEEKAATVMREFERTTRAATRVTTANSNELIFFRYYNLTSPSPSKVRYFVDQSVFKIGITEPSGVEPNITYESANERIDLIVPDLTDSNNLFKYYNGNEEELAGVFDVANVRVIELNVSLDKDAALPPLPVNETTKVMLRNMKDNL